MNQLIRYIGFGARFILPIAIGVGASLLIFGGIWKDSPQYLNALFSIILGGIGGFLGMTWAMKYWETKK